MDGLTQIKVYSSKYSIEGIIYRFGGIVTWLEFSYQGRTVKMGISNNVFKITFEEYGELVINTYIEKLATEGGRRLMLHYWYIDSGNVAHGIVSGHPNIEDTTKIHTSPILGIELYDCEEMIIYTINSKYHCPLPYIRFCKQDQYPDMIPDYEQIKQKYQDKLQEPEIEENKILLVLSNFDDYYFHSLYCKKGGENRMKYMNDVHVGNFQDSVLISTEDYQIDIRYFPHYQNIEFYCVDTNEMPLYIENIGDIPIYCKTSCGLIRMNPGERKEVIKENAEQEKLTLPSGDLYPAGMAVPDNEED